MGLPLIFIVSFPIILGAEDHVDQDAIARLACGKLVRWADQ